VPPPVALEGYDSATIWAFFATQVSRYKELIRKAIEPHLLRRRKQDVFPELPSKLRTDEWLDLDADQRAEYEAALAEGRQEFSSGRQEFSRIHIFALLNRLKRICNFAKGKDHSPKTTAALEHIEAIVDSGKKVLVFTQYKEEGVSKLKRLLDRFGVEVITGDSSERQRLRAVETFQADPIRRIFLATPKAAGEGLTLTAASYVIHFDQWWNPAVAWQAEDRAHRKGQTEPVNVYSFWMRGTVEQRIHTILKRKGLLHREIIDSLSEADFDETLTLDDLLSVLDLRREAVRIR
jgi:SNF2 family DNA or RNA helicase